MKHYRTADGEIYGADSGPDKASDTELSARELKSYLLVQEEISKTKKAEMDYIEKVRLLAVDRDEDIDRKEADEFSLFWSRYSVTGKTPPIKQYPLVAAQIEEWDLKGLLN